MGVVWAAWLVTNGPQGSAVGQTCLMPVRVAGGVRLQVDTQGPRVVEGSPQQDSRTPNVAKRPLVSPQTEGWGGPAEGRGRWSLCGKGL